MNRFVTYEEVKEVISRGSTRSSVKLRSGLNADLRVVPDKSFGAALITLPDRNRTILPFVRRA